MRIREIASNIYSLGIVLAAVSAVLYLTVIAPKVDSRRNGQYRFQGAIEVAGKEVFYEGTRPYTPFLRYFKEDRNGHAGFRSPDDKSIYFEYEDLTEDSLEGRIRLTLSNGDEGVFNQKGIYMEGDLKDPKRYEQKIRGAISYFQSINDAVEAAIREAIAKR